MTTHTPGPWTASPTRRGILGDPDSYKDNGFAITAKEPKMYGGTPVAAVSITRRIVGPDEWSDETEGNARIIGLAPDMLSALRAASAWLDDHLDACATQPVEVSGADAVGPCDCLVGEIRAVLEAVDE